MSTPQSELSPARRELLRLLTGRGTEPEPIVTLPESAPKPLSLVQERMWVSEKFAGRPVGGTYSATVTLKGAVDAQALTWALGEIYKRHAVLRSTFPMNSDEPLQLIRGEVTPRIPIHDLSGLPEAERDARLKDLVDQEARWEVDMGEWPLLRLSLVKLAPDDHVMLFSYHHMVCDGGSTGLFYAELGELYAAAVEGRAPALPSLPVQYADFAAWQRKQAARPEVGAHVNYFKERLAGELPPLELPADRPRTPQRDFSGGTHAFWLPPGLTTGFKELARTEGTTPYVTLLAAFLAVMNRCSGQEDLTVASPVTNRARRELESLIGCFMHPVVLRTDLSGDPTFRELLARVRAVWLEAFSHVEAPFELVMRAIRPHLDSVHMPVFQVLFNVQPASRGKLQMPGIQVGDPQLHVRSAALDLSIDMWIDEDRTRGDVEYSAELFDESTVAWIMRCFVNLLSSVVSNPDQKLSRIPVSGVDPGEEIEPRMQSLSDRRRELLRLLAGEKMDRVLAPARAADPARIGTHPCSFGQERLWFMDRLNPQSAIYNQTQVVRLEGPLDLDAFRRALDEIVRRHDILRTAIRAEKGRPVQVVAAEGSARLVIEDLSDLTPAEQEARADLLLQEQSRQVLDLSDPPLARVVLLRLSPTSHLMASTVHHLIADGWSIRVFRHEVAEIYRAFVAGEPSPLPELQMQYAGYARRQRAWHREAIVGGQLTYWKRKLSGDLPVTQLPIDLPRPADLNYGRNVTTGFTLDGVGAELDALRESTGATSYMIFLAAFLTMLQRYTGQEDMVIDTPVSGRTHTELEGLIGFFVNSLVLRADLGGQPTFRELVLRVRQMCLEAYANQELPFDKVVSQLQLPSERRSRPLTSISFMLHETVAKNEELGAGVHVIPAGYDISDEFDLSLVIWQGSDEWSGDVQYDPRLFHRESASRLAHHYTNLLRHALAEPDTQIRELELMPEGERIGLMDSLSSGQLAIPAGTNLVTLVEGHAAMTPDARALISPPVPGTTVPDQILSYSELNSEANRLARVLIAHGVEAGSRVGICLNRGTRMIVAVLAVLKAGAAYVPLDPAHGPERLLYMLEDSKAKVVLTQDDLLVEWDLHAEVIEIDKISETLAAQPDHNPEVPVDPDELAYVVYTSGSTGRPKGVMVSHRSLMNAYYAWEDAYRLKGLRSHLQMASFSFDVFAGDLIRALGSGATLVLCPRESLLMAPELTRLIQHFEIECAEFVPAVIRPLMEHLMSSGSTLSTMKLAIVGSDVWYLSELDRLRRLLGTGTRVVNSYGVAEATIDSTWHEGAATQPTAETMVPIGRPFPNTSAFVLDTFLNLVPIGAEGELYLGGPGLARGYSDRPGLTAERFVPNPFPSEPGARLYRTGDRVRHLPDGSIAFLGRIDNQIKVRGFRIEPGEIEAAITRHTGVNAATVVVREDRPQVRGLAAYVEVGPEAMADQSEFVTGLRIHLKEWLPDHMLPSWIVLLDKIPLTPNGKVDRKALPAPKDAPQGITINPPRTEVQKRIAGIWSELLGEERVGITDNFFDLGGHSLLLFEMQNRLKAAFGTELPIVDLFRLTTVEELARRLGGIPETNDPLAGVEDRVNKQQASLRRQRAARYGKGPEADE